MRFVLNTLSGFGAALAISLFFHNGYVVTHAVLALLVVSAWLDIISRIKGGEK